MTTPSNELRSGTQGQLCSLAADTSFSTPTRAIRGTGAGVIKVDFVDGGSAVLWPFADGETQLLQVTKVYSTANGTTCTGVSVLF